MPADTAPSNTIVFEVPDCARAEGLCELLRPRWFVGSYASGDVVLVAADLRPQQGDLPALLRAVELWVADAKLGALRFHLDARAYVLEGGSTAPGEIPALFHPLEGDFRRSD